MTVLVLLPGLDGTARLLTDFTQAIRPAFEDVQALSYPGDRAADYAQLEALVRPLLPQQHPFVLLGESFSGPLALAIAAAPPPNLVGLVLSTTFARHPVRSLRPFAALTRFAPVRTLPSPLLAWWLFGRWVTPQRLATLRNALLTVEPAILRARTAAALRADATPCLARIRMPVLCLRARADRLLWPRTTQQLLAGLPQARLVELDAPHLLLQTAPEAAARAIAGFAREIGARPDSSLREDRHAGLLD